MKFIVELEFVGDWETLARQLQTHLVFKEPPTLLVPNRSGGSTVLKPILVEEAEQHVRQFLGGVPSNESKAYGFAQCSIALYQENARLRSAVDDLIHARDLAQRQLSVMRESEQAGAKAKIAYLREHYPK